MKQRSQISIYTEPVYLSEHSDPARERYVFAYFITLHNPGPLAVQLLHRHWSICDANGKVEEVVGEGVVGEQPVIEAGGEYVYNSFCVLETPVGCMEGHYHMIDEDGDQFDTAIPRFTLAVPGVLN